MSQKIYVIDIESNGLLSQMIDYSCFPYKLKQDAKLWVVSVRDYKENIVYSATENNITKEWLKGVLKDCTHLVAHNGLKFDFPVLKLFGVLDYTVGYLDQPDTIFGKEVVLVDTLILSRLFKPDRFGGHSLDVWGQRLKEYKTDFRQACIDRGIIDKHAPSGAEFSTYSDVMKEYCEQDVLVTSKLLTVLLKEKAEYDGWDMAIKQENKLADLSVYREHFGFAFDKDLALKLLQDLTNKMDEIASKINPILPPKKMNKGELSLYTPPVNQLDYSEVKATTPPKNQLKKDGGLSATMEKFIEKNGLILEGDGLFFNGEFLKLPLEEPLIKKPKPSQNMINFTQRVGGELIENIFIFEGKEYSLPMEIKPLKEYIEASIDDLDHVKHHLIELGWKPIEWRERNLVQDAKKITLPLEKRIAALDRWLEDTFNGKYMNERLSIMKCYDRDQLRDKLLERLHEDFPVRVPTSPSIRVGVVKDLCPNLIKTGEKVDFAKDFSLYLTYRHRKSSIAGGNIEDYDFDEEVPNTGFLSNYREVDGRIPTPAIEVGANSHRYRHISVSNIPRLSSEYGKEMRSLFGCGRGFVQLGYDYSSLENRIMGHYVTPYTEGEQLATAMVAEKPNDFHSLNASKIGISRTDAKSVSYACLPMNTKILTINGWKYYNDIEEGEEILSYNTKKDIVEKDIILKKHFFKDKVVKRYKNKFSYFDCTEDHRWYGWKRSRSKATDKVWGFIETKDITSECNFILTAPYIGGNSIITPDESALIGWVLSEGTISWSKRGEGTSASFGKRKGVTVSITQSERNFTEEIRNLLDRLGLVFMEYKRGYDDVVDFRLKSDVARELLDRLFGERFDKHNYNWSKWVCTLKRESLISFIDAFFKADGNYKSFIKNGQYIISQNIGNIYEGIVTALQLLGDGRLSFSNHTLPCRTIRKQTRRHITTQELNVEPLGIQDTFCLTTNNSTFIIWQDDFIGITGNCLYGAQPNKLATMLGRDLNYGKKIYNDYWEAVPALKELKEKVEKFWDKNGQSYLVAIDKRKLNTRSKHSLLNTLFQSAGVIAAKYTTVLMFEKFQKMGYCINPFEGKPDVISMIEYHDEAQLAINPKLLSFETFDSEEEAKKYVEENKNKGYSLSSISYGKKWYVCLPNDVSKAIEDAVKEASELLQLRVNLGIEWIVGKNWAECH